MIDFEETTELIHLQWKAELSYQNPMCGHTALDVLSSEHLQSDWYRAWQYYVVCWRLSVCVHICIVRLSNAPVNRSCEACYRACPGIWRPTGPQGVGIIMSLSHYRIIYIFNIPHASRPYFPLTRIEDWADFEFYLAKESTRAEQRNRLECSDANPNPPPNIKGIASSCLAILLRREVRSNSTLLL